MSGQKRSVFDRVQFDWLEGDVAQSWQNEWNAKVAKVATLRDQRGGVGDGRNGVGGGGIGGSGVGWWTSRGKSEQREGLRFKKTEIPILGHGSHNALQGIFSEGGSATRALKSLSFFQGCHQRQNKDFHTVCSLD